jgi:hypothetical protein
MLSRVDLLDENDLQHPVLTLSPIAVDPGLQGSGLDDG